MDRLVVFRGSGIAIALIIVAATLVGVRPGAGAQASGPVPKRGSAGFGNAENGKRLFRSVGCWECHGYEGQGGPAGARIGPPAIPLAAFLAYVRQPKGQMPPYTAKALKDPDLKDIYAFLQAIPKPPPVKNIPLLNN